MQPVPHSIIRILIADDHAMVRKGLARLVSEQPEFEMVGEAGTGAEAVRLVRQLRPDVLLLDIQMPEGDGLWVLDELRVQDLETRVLVLTVSTDDEHLKGCLRRGASGYLLKSSPVEALFHAVRVVADGQTTVPAAMAGRVLTPSSALPRATAAGDEPVLSLRQEQVLRILARGSTNRGIADALEISENTVKAHIKGILHKLGVGNRVEAAGWALRHLEGLDE